MVFRREVLWVEGVRVDKILLIIDDILEIHMDNPSFGDDNVGVRDLVVFCTFSLMRGHQISKPHGLFDEHLRELETLNKVIGDLSIMRLQIVGDLLSNFILVLRELHQEMEHHGDCYSYITA